jgi:hypothetical protein
MSLCWDEKTAEPLRRGGREHAPRKEKEVVGNRTALPRPVSTESTGTKEMQEASKQQRRKRSGKIELLISPIFTEYAGRILV